MPEHFTHFDELDDATQKLAMDETRLVEIVGEPWTDDHQPCVDLKFVDQYEGKPPVEASLWWIGWEILAAARFANDSEEANDILIKYLETKIGE